MSDSRVKIAVTGASGFIGQHILKELAHSSVEVIAITRDASKLSGFDAKNIRVVEMDISHSRSNNYDLLYCPDVLIHLAWHDVFNFRSLHHFEEELPNQYNFIKGLVNDGLSNILVAGTCFEYGLQSGALSEDILTAPANPYGYAKDSLRKQLELLQSESPFSLTWARLFYMYGEGQSKKSLFSQLADAVNRGDVVFNMSGGEQLRDYLPVEEVVSYILQLALFNKNSGVVNICSGEPVSVRKLVEIWLYQKGWSIDLNLGYYPYSEFEPMAFWGNRVKLDSILSV